jgi:hypothetical protein
MGPRVVGMRSDVRDVQERWVDAREEGMRMRGRSGVGRERR